MESPGAKLKKIRLGKGITLEEVQRNTKIQLNILKAIEGDSFTDISPVYLKGFLKIYCRFLGQDYNGYISEYKSLQSQIKEEIKPKEVPKKEKKPHPLIKSASLKLLTIRSSNKIKTGLKIILVAVILGIGLFNLAKIKIKRAPTETAAEKQTGETKTKEVKPKGC